MKLIRFGNKGDEKPGVEIIACHPENSPEMYLSVKQGRPVEGYQPQETLSDGSAGGCEPDSITFPLCRDLVDDYLLISEDEIAAAIRWSTPSLALCAGTSC